MRFKALFILVTILVMVAGASAQGTYKRICVAHTLGDCPTSSLVMGETGNLFGTSGYAQYSWINELTPRNDGTWAETGLYNFVGTGYNPQPQARLIFDKKGNLYGTTFFGGDGLNQILCYGALEGCGTVYEFSPSSGVWTALCDFTGLTTDGGNPYGGLVWDSSGNLYGTTSDQGTWGYGTVFELVHTKHGWVEKTLYNFTGGDDGADPWTGVLLGKDGNLYGVNTGGDSNSYTATIYKLTRTNKGEWPLTVLYTVTNMGVHDVTFGPDGNLYGTCSLCDQNTGGQVFQLAQKNGTWKMRILHDFGNGQDGAYPINGLVFDSKGNFYGQTAQGGVANSGTLFKLAKNSSGKWKESTLFSFPHFACDVSQATLLMDPAEKNLYGSDGCMNTFSYKLK